MYEYDPKTRQYRRRLSPEEQAVAEQKVAEAAVDPSASAVPAEQNPAYAIRDEEDIQYKAPRAPGMTPGKIIFWSIFAIIFCGWMYFMYNMYIQDQQGAPRDMESLIEDSEEFEEILSSDPPIKPEDVELLPDGTPATNIPLKISAPLRTTD